MVDGSQCMTIWTIPTRGQSTWHDERDLVEKDTDVLPGALRSEDECGPVDEI